MSLKINFKKDIEEILADNYLSEELKQYSTKVSNVVQEEKNKIIEQYTYCPICKDYYKKEFFKNIEKQEIRSFCTNSLMGYLEPYEYEDRKVWIKYLECPKGHLNEI